MLMKIVKNIVKYLLLIVLIIAIISIILLTNLSKTILNKNYILENFEKSNFYANMENEVIENFEKYILQSGLEETVIENIVSEQKIEEDVEGIINAIYDGTDYKIDTTTIETKLKENINNYLAEYKLTEENEKTISQFIKTIGNEYKILLDYTDYTSRINHIYNKIITIKNVIEPILITCIIVICIVLLIIEYKQIYNIISLFGIAMLSTGIFYIVCTYILKLNVKIENMQILNDSISKVIINIIQGIVDKINSMNIYIIVAGILFIIISNIIKSIKMKNTEDKE